MIENVVNIIVIGYKLRKIEAACLDSIVRFTTYPHLLTYYDNWGSGLSLTEVWNALIKASPCRYLCLLNSDTVVSSKWLTRMMDTLASDKKIAFVGPSTNNCHSPQKAIPSEKLALKHPGVIEIMKDPISGFCLLFRKALWEELNGFDTRYKLYGQESDFIDRAQKKGHTCAWRKDSFVFHHGEASVRAHGHDAKAERYIAKKIYWTDRGKAIK